MVHLEPKNTHINRSCKNLSVFVLECKLLGFAHLFPTHLWVSCKLVNKIVSKTTVQHIMPFDITSYNNGSIAALAVLILLFHYWMPVLRKWIGFNNLLFRFYYYLLAVHDSKFWQLCIPFANCHSICRRKQNCLQLQYCVRKNIETDHSTNQ